LWHTSCQFITCCNLSKDEVDMYRVRNSSEVLHGFDGPMSMLVIITFCKIEKWRPREPFIAISFKDPHQWSYFINLKRITLSTMQGALYVFRLDKLIMENKLPPYRVDWWLVFYYLLGLNCFSKIDMKILYNCIWI